VTLNLPDRIGMNASIAAEAARLQAIADSAIRRSGFSTSVGTPDRGGHQNVVHGDHAASSVRAPGEAGTTREDRVRTSAYFVRRGPNPLFLTQMLAQDEQPVVQDPVSRAGAVAAYPSLESDIDIFLPGEDIAFVDTSRRVDIYA
jgi:hypothetical protein